MLRLFPANNVKNTFAPYLYVVIGLLLAWPIGWYFSVTRSTAIPLIFFCTIVAGFFLTLCFSVKTGILFYLCIFPVTIFYPFFGKNITTDEFVVLFAVFFWFVSGGYKRIFLEKPTAIGVGFWLYLLSLLILPINSLGMSWQTLIVRFVRLGEAFFLFFMFRDLLETHFHRVRWERLFLPGFAVVCLFGLGEIITVLYWAEGAFTTHLHWKEMLVSLGLAPVNAREDFFAGLGGGSRGISSIYFVTHALGMYLGVALLFIWFFARKSNGNRSTYLGYAALACGALLLLYSGSRTSQFALAGSIVVSLVLMRRLELRPVLLFTLLLAVTILLMPEDLRNRILLQKGTVGTLYVRFASQLLSLYIISQNWLLGAGIQSFDKFAGGVDPHNNYLMEIQAKGIFFGTAALCVMFIPLFIAWRELLQRRDHKRELAFPCMVIFFVAITGLVGNFFNDIRLATPFVFSVALLDLELQGKLK